MTASVDPASTASSPTPASGPDALHPAERPGPRLRFCPSPTGVPHVGLFRTALSNWAHARHVNGTLVFRIEDTDAARDSEQSYQMLLEAMRWMGIDWDEGVEVGGPFGPYRQSERRPIYDDVLAKLIDAGYVYEAFSTTDEVAARHRAAGRDPVMGYDNFDRDLTDAQKAEYRAQGRVPVYRFRMPDSEIRFVDAVRGEVVFAAGSTPDYVVARADGTPLYTLTNPIDDAMMRIELILRGEDLLSSTPRQIPLHRALIELGIGVRMPDYGHLPYVMGQGNKKLSKRDPQSNLFLLRDKGFIPEGLGNYLMLLGWSIGADRDVFSMAEAVEAFDVHDINPSPARFDLAKATAINGDHIRMLAEDDFAERLVPYLQAGGVLPAEPSAQQLGLLRQAAPLVQTRMALLGEVSGLLGFLFVEPDAFAVDEADAAKFLATDEGQQVLTAGRQALQGVSDADWQHESIEAALRASLVDGLGLKPRKAFGPLRVAVTGSRISPPLFESMQLLGQAECLRRISAALSG
jgi:glutamyl-tRNA synthetase